MVEDESPRTSRAGRLHALRPAQRDELFRIIGEAAIDLWIAGETWPDIVERCLEAVEEEDPAQGPVTVRVERSGGDRAPG